ncbi:TVP38/TMEM64 family protein [Bacillus timonensis]|nr:TVP38/TMEM64 family protein [Bacillus timonensis]
MSVLNQKTVLKVTGIVVVVAGLLWFNSQYLNVTPQSIREWILSFGLLAPLVFIGIYTLRPLILFPASILSLTAGLAFGALWGSIFSIIGATGGAILAFMISRKLGHNVSKGKWKGKGERIQVQLEKNGFFYVLLLRLIPILNFDMISYLSGLSKVRFTHFLLGTILGIIPGAFAYNFLGASLVGENLWTFVGAVVVFVIVSLVPIITSSRVREKLGFQRKE